MAYFPCHATSPDFLEKKSLGKNTFICGVAYLTYFISIVWIFPSLYTFSVTPRITFNRRFYFMGVPRSVFLITSDHFIPNVPLCPRKYQ